MLVFKHIPVLLLLAAIGTLSGTARAEDNEFHESVSVVHPPRWLTIPIELAQSTAWVGRPGPAARVNAGLYPGFLVQDQWWLQGAAELHYRNPDWDAALGARVGCVLSPALNGYVPVSLIAELTHFTSSNGFRGGGGLSFGLGKLAYLAFISGYENDRKAYFTQLGLGLDLPELFSDPVAGITHFIAEER